MPKYVKKVLNRLQNPKPKRPQYAPHLCKVSTYVKIPQMAPDPYDRNILTRNPPKEYSIKWEPCYIMPCQLIQLCYEQLMKYCEPNQIQQGTQRKKARMLLDFAATYLNSIIHYKASNMVLHVDSYAAYITMTEARSCYDEHFYLRNWTSPRPEKPNLDRNSPIHKECKTICNVVSSVEVPEKSGNFNNGKTDIVMRPALITFDHKQPEKPSEQTILR